MILVPKRKTFIVCDLAYWECLYECSINYGHSEEKKRCEQECAKHCEAIPDYD